MELCKTCKSKICAKNIITKKEENLKIIKCLGYQKDENKIVGYKEPLSRTANQQKAIMKLAI